MASDLVDDNSMDQHLDFGESDSMSSWSVLYDAIGSGRITQFDDYLTTVADPHGCVEHPGFPKPASLGWLEHADCFERIDDGFPNPMNGCEHQAAPYAASAQRTIRRDSHGAFVEKTCDWNGCNMPLESITVPYIRGHFKTHHDLKKETMSSNSQIVKCGFSGCDSKLRFTSIAKHVANSHFKVNQQLRHECRKQYSTKEALDRHVADCHFSAERFPCPACGQEFPTTDALHQHRDSSPECAILQLPQSITSVEPRDEDVLSYLLSVSLVLQ